MQVARWVGRARNLDCRLEWHADLRFVIAHGEPILVCALRREVKANVWHAASFCKHGDNVRAEVYKPLKEIQKIRYDASGMPVMDVSSA